MRELYRYFGSRNIRPEQHIDSPLHAIDICHEPTSGEISCDIRNLSDSDSDIHIWLANGSTMDDLDGSLTHRLARIVIAGRDSRQTWRSSPEALQVAAQFGLTYAYNYAMGCVAGVVALPPESQPSARMSAYIFVHSKLAVIWSTWQDSTASPSISDARHTLAYPMQVIILADTNERYELLSLLQHQWLLALTSRDMFPALLCGIVMCQEIDLVQGGIHDKMFPIEARTGHHNSLRQQQPARGSWGDLTASLSGLARKLASTSRKIHISCELLQFMLDHLDKGVELNTGEDTANLMEHCIQLIESRFKMQRLQNDFLVRKVDIQQTAIYDFMAHDDNSIALQASFSMKILALLALLFLPGSFIAALFSAPLFDWDDADANELNSIGVRTKPQFQMFWAITIPLTTLAFMGYMGWSLIQRRRSRRQGFGVELNEEDGFN